MKVVSVVSATGGTGKTTLAASLACVLAKAGRRVVAVDLAPQNALRLHFGVPLDRTDGVASALLDANDWQSAIVESADDVALLPFGALDFERLQTFARHLEANRDAFAQGLSSLQLGTADIVVIDTPPGDSPFTRAALSAADFALNVALADAASYAAFAQTQAMIESFAATRPEFAGEACVINQADQSRQLNKDVIRVLRDLLGDRMFPGVIHSDEGVREALACNTTIEHYDASSQAAADIRECATWLLDALETTGVSRRSVA
jgi:cellulose synthase operon protein YhjQ